MRTANRQITESSTLLSLMVKELVAVRNLGPRHTVLIHLLSCVERFQHVERRRGDAPEVVRVVFLRVVHHAHTGRAGMA